MDPKRFDAFTRAMDLTRTRRGAFGAIGAALSALTLAPELTDARKRRRKRRNQSGSDCIDCNERAAAPGADLKRCDLRGRDLSGADLRSADLAGACLQNANLSGAELRSADLEGADVHGANLTDANLDRADIRNWKAADAIFCRTTMPDGEINTVSCLPGGGASCLGLNQLCSFTGGTPCCDYGQQGKVICDGTLPFITACQAKCRSDADCQNLVGSTDVYCANDPVSDFGCAGRNFDPNVHCCGRKTCEVSSDCKSGLCCEITDFFSQCCLPGEHCNRAFGGCVR